MRWVLPPTHRFNSGSHSWRTRESRRVVVPGAHYRRSRGVVGGLAQPGCGRNAGGSWPGAENRAQAAVLREGWRREFPSLPTFISLFGPHSGSGVTQPDYRDKPPTTTSKRMMGRCSWCMTRQPGTGSGAATRPTKNYVAGPLKGQSVPISRLKCIGYQMEAERVWGKLIPGNAFVEPRFIPGTQRQGLPIWGKVYE